MKYFQKHEQGIYNLINENENYIIFNDGKAIRVVIDGNSDDLLDITVGDAFSCEDICQRERPKEEYDIIKKAKFTNIIHIYKSIDLKVIHINDDESNINVVYDIKDKIKVNITNIYYMIEKDTNMLVEINCNENSQVNYTTYMRSFGKLNICLNGYLEDKANLNINSLSFNKNIVKQMTNVYLYRPFSSLFINNTIFNATGLKQVFDFNIYHQFADNKSEMINYAIANNKSTLELNSNGIILKNAKRSQLLQKSQGTILDNESSISANPLLQIDELDVLASHGAAIGAISEDDLYYLMSRGLTKEMSEQLLIKALLNPCLTKIIDEKVLAIINEDLKQLL